MGLLARGWIGIPPGRKTIFIPIFGKNLWYFAALAVENGQLVASDKHESSALATLRQIVS